MVRRQDLTILIIAVRGVCCRSNPDSCDSGFRSVSLGWREGLDVTRPFTLAFQVKLFLKLPMHSSTAGLIVAFFAHSGVLLSLGPGP